MPSSSLKQHRFMEAIAHNKAFAKKAGVPQSVGEDFSNADKGKKFKQGGSMNKKMNPKLAAIIAAGASGRPPMGAPMGGAPMGGAPAGGSPMGMPPGMKHGGLSKAHHKHLAEHHLAMAEHHHEMHKGGKTHKYAKGGAIETMGSRNMHEDVEKGSDKLTKHGESAVQKRGHTKGMEPKMHNDGLNDIGTSGMRKGGKVHKFAEGGHIGSSVHKRADGIAERGHTKTKMYKHGGKC